jgi:Flp pilus assembly protein TadD
MLSRAATLARAGRHGKAQALLADILARVPNQPRALHLLASIAEHQGDRARAAHLLAAAAAAHPDDFLITAHLAAVLRALGRFDESIRHGRSAAALRPLDPAVHNDLAMALMEYGDYAAAESSLLRAIALDPGFAEPHNNRGLIAQQTGRPADAVSHFQRVLALKPDAAYAYVNLIDSYTIESADDPHLKEVERRLAQSDLKDADRALLLFALAKAKNDLGRHRAAFETALAASSLKRRGIRYDEAATHRYFDALARIFSADFVRGASASGFAGAAPIFVIGMPRSGSTLVEQILSSHPSVHGAGELHDLSNAVDAVRSDAALPAWFESAPHGAWRAIGERYAASVRRRAPDAARIVDKMPTNFLLAGVIRLALPQAKIVHVHRDPIDTCTSCFSKHFAAELNHTYDLGEIGRYYRAYHGLMQHWRAVLPPAAMFELSYEALVDDLEAQSRRLLDYCGVPWDDAVLRFHQNARPVRTLSAAQVRRPLYRSSVGRWREHADLLQPLFAALGDLAKT